jgi:hypothetical protein
MKSLLPLALTLMLATPAVAGGRIDEICTPDVLPSVSDPHPVLSQIFAKANDPAPSDPYFEDMGPREVLLARIGADGKLELSCVNDEKSARAFLEARTPRARTTAEEK